MTTVLAMDVPPLEQVASVALTIAIGLALYAGAGCAIAVLRVVLPGLANAADRSIQGLRVGRMLVTGVLPVVGAILVAWALHRAGVPEAWALAVWIPLLLLVLLGALAGVPYLGENLQRASAEPSPLRSALLGGAAIGLAQVTWLFPLAGLLVSLLLFGWLVGIGLGVLVRRA